jgi:hypothetical protein
MAPDEVAGPTPADDQGVPSRPKGAGSPWMRPQLPRLPGWGSPGSGTEPAVRGTAGDGLAEPEPHVD